MKRFPNKRQANFLDQLPQKALTGDSCETVRQSKYNFAYMDFNQGAITSLENYGGKRTQDLFNKLKALSEFPLEHWKREPVGKGKNHVLEIYGDFPKKSNFSHPKHVPHDVAWGRFRFGSALRLVGFVMPDKLQDVEHEKHRVPFDGNTFYIVYFDPNHEFYQT